MTFTNAAQTEAWVRAFARGLTRPSVVLLSGDLGAGKTQFSRWIGAELGTSEVASPTFAIHHEYQTPGGLLDHVDLYRLKDEAELEGVGFWDLLANEQGLLLVEWADRLPNDVWPTAWTRHELRVFKGEGEARRVELATTPPATKSPTGR